MLAEGDARLGSQRLEADAALFAGGEGESKQVLQGAQVGGRQVDYDARKARQSQQSVQARPTQCRVVAQLAHTQQDLEQHAVRCVAATAVAFAVAGLLRLQTLGFEL